MSLIPKKIVIERILTACHRYPTAGDYYVDPDGTLHVRVSSELSDKATVLLLMHELNEMFMCMLQGVDFHTIDEFDKAFEAKQGDIASEPGDSMAAPYHVQHVRAETLERILAEYIGFDWQVYGEEFDQLCLTIDRLKNAGIWD